MNEEIYTGEHPIDDSLGYIIGDGVLGLLSLIAGLWFLFFTPMIFISFVCLFMALSLLIAGIYEFICWKKGINTDEHEITTESE